MAMSKVILLAFVVTVLVATVSAQFGGIYDLGFGLGGKPFGKPFGKPGFGGLGGFGGKPGLGGLGGKPGKPGNILGGGLFDLYRFHSPEDAGVPYYDWESAPTNN